MQRSLLFYLLFFIAIVILFIPLLSSKARAEGVTLRTKHKYTFSGSKTKSKTTGDTIDTNASIFDQLYDLDLSKTIYPYLRFDAGAVYELNKTTSTSGDFETDMTEQILRPFVELNLDNPIYKAGIAYRKRQIEDKISGLPDTRADRDEINILLGMDPDEIFPRWDLRYNQLHTHDNPETVDDIERQLTLDTGYTLFKALNLDYLYSLTEKENKLKGFTTEEEVHFGRIDYSRSFWDGRFAVGTGYRIRYQSLKIPENATIQSPLARSSGLSSLDKTPEDGPALDINNLLIDGNFIASAGMNLGTNGDQLESINIGLDFGFAVDVDQIRIWVDRRLTGIVSNSFSWSVYSSPDNIDSSTWTLIATVFPAVFGAFDNRFEVSFPKTNTRFIKVVANALSLTDSGGADFPDIFVTEMEAFITLRGVQVDREQKTIDQNIDLNLRGRLGDKTSVGYTLLYSLREDDPANEERTSLTHSVYLSHIFNRLFSASANGQRSDTTGTDEDTVSDTYGVSLKANWLYTFDQTLTYSGRSDTDEDGSGRQDSIFLRSNARLYRGWSAFLDMGYTWEEAIDRPKAASTLIRTGTDVEPNRKIILNVDYAYKATDESGVDGRSSTETDLRLQVFYNPFDNLSLFARLDVVDRGEGIELFQNYSINWSPFPDGDLQFFFVYTETLRSESESRDTVVGPGLKWTVGRHILFDMTYNFIKTENKTQITDSNVFAAELRLVF